ncbi:LOB domain-containing protein 7 [Manihot esculenta]|uniref:LOB domain-containing protein n=1 Tax=Manihot esculenta TaxID=3983 RepID=A0A2C9UAT6_MANES|nr:LOB domain-containing protein 7 [Manihot esculenta]OAY26866.1 hypothetical protein MANES_16G081175v8 [Manihot esculenta]
MITASTGSQACAACKYLRKKCAADCPLAPYFPSNHSSDFLNAHKLFGVSKILKTLNKLRTSEEKKNAIKSMIYQANARARDPVGGCSRIISQLKNQIEFYQLQLSLVRQQIEFHQRLPLNDDLQVSPIDIYDATTLESSGYPTPSIVQKRSYQIDDAVANIDMEKLSLSGLSGHGSQPSSSGNEAVAVDASQDVKPFLGEFHERDNTVGLLKN